MPNMTSSGVWTRVNAGSDDEPPTLPARHIDRLRRPAPDAHDLAAELRIPWYRGPTPSPPSWVREHLLDALRLFSRHGRDRLALKRRLKEQILEARIDLDHLVTYLDERAQGQHLRQFIREEHQLIDAELLEEMRSIYPGRSDDWLRRRMDSWRRNVRRQHVYAPLETSRSTSPVRHKPSTK